MLTTNTGSAPVEIIYEVFRHATRLPPLNCDNKFRVFFKEHLGTLLTITGLYGRWCTDPTLWTKIFIDAMSPILLHLHLGRSAGLRLKVFTIDLHPVTHSIICDEAYRFRRFNIET